MEILNSRQKVLQALTATYQQARQMDVNADTARFIFFSDHHRGNRGVSDYFRYCEKTYNAALGYYLDRGYHLILVGDVEELWQYHPEYVFPSYPLSYELEREFYLNQRFTKIRGNHDNLWKNESMVRKYLDKYFPGIEVLDSLRLNLSTSRGKSEGTLFAAHGHQGSFLNDTIDWVGMLGMRYVGNSMINPFKRKFQTPATSYSLRARHDRLMFDFSEQINGNEPERILFVAGHTHHPIFMSANRIHRLQNNIEALKTSDSKKALRLRAKLRSRLEYIKADLAMDPQLLNQKSYYFNTGSCSFFDGSITGLELIKGKLRLVKWVDDSLGAERIILNSEKLKDI